MKTEALIQTEIDLKGEASAQFGAAPEQDTRPMSDRVSFTSRPLEQQKPQLLPSFTVFTDRGILYKTPW